MRLHPHPHAVCVDYMKLVWWSWFEAGLRGLHEAGVVELV